jgi:hypothetical protein
MSAYGPKADHRGRVGDRAKHGSSLFKRREAAGRGP